MEHLKGRIHFPASNSVSYFPSMRPGRRLLPQHRLREAAVGLLGGAHGVGGLLGLLLALLAGYPRKRGEAT